MGKRKKLEKAAKKAYKRARKSVDEAVRTAERADDAARKRAKKLEDRLAAVPKRAEPGAGRPPAPPRPSTPVADADADVDLTPPLPTSAVEDPEAGRTPGTPPHDPQLDRLTVEALRDVARSRDLRNVSRLTKAQLIERLSE
jgi:hypothetical protein